MVTIRLQKIGNSFMATIPRWALAQLKWNRGDMLSVELGEGVLKLRPLMKAAVSKPRIPKADGEQITEMESGTL